jgi:Tol biopolymer transport system component
MRLLAVVLVGGAVLAGLAFAATATTERVSVTPSGGEPNNANFEPSVSAGGRYVAFTSYATDILPGTNDGHASQIYVYDRSVGETQLASASSTGEPGNDYSVQPVISADGRHVAFTSAADNLVPDDSNQSRGVYWRDLQTGETRRVDVSSTGLLPNLGKSASPSISADGNVVTFSSSATNLTPVKSRALHNEFAHYMDSGKTVQVNVSPQGKGGTGDCQKAPTVSGDGRLIAFASRGTNLVKGGSKGSQIFVRDLKTKKTVVASQSSSGKVGNGRSTYPVISGDGRFVAFDSESTNLVEGDTNRTSDVFVRDLTKRTTKRVSVTAEGGQANGSGGEDFGQTSISNHGGFVAFLSLATNLAGHHDGHVYLYSGRGGPLVQQVDVTNKGASANGVSTSPAVSADGSLVAFVSNATNLVAGPAAAQTDIYTRGPLH